MKRRVVSIFSGIDCLGLGFRKDFDVVLAVEKEAKACDTLIANKEKFHPNLEVWNEDILLVSDSRIEEYKGVDGIIGGPPCQPFSSARGSFDPDNKKIKCLFEYIRWVKIIQPKFFMFENVKGLLEKTKFPIFEYFLEQLRDLGYSIDYKLLNSHDYGSVQKRERVIAVGFKKELEVSFNFPNPVSEKKYVRDIIIEGEEVGECAKYDAKKMEVVPHIPEGGNWKNLKSEELLRKALLGNYEKREGGMTGVYRRLDRNGHCPTLTTSPGQRNTMIIHPLEDRPLSVKEYMRAQGIPADYNIVGSTAKKYTFIGNGVPVEMAYELSKAISKTLDEIEPKADEDLILQNMRASEYKVELKVESNNQFYFAF